MSGEILYIIYDLAKKCKVSFRGVEYDYNEIHKLIKKKEKEHLEKLNKENIIHKNYYGKLENIELSKEQVDFIDFKKNKSNALSWLSRQRSIRRKGKLEQHKIDELNKLGMLWNPLTDEWEKNYKKFIGHGFIFPLENWINEQRELFNRKKIEKENLQRLRFIDFPFKEDEDEKFEFAYWQLYDIMENFIYQSKLVKNSNSKKVSKEKRNTTNDISDVLRQKLSNVPHRIKGHEIISEHAHHYLKPSVEEEKKIEKQRTKHQKKIDDLTKTLEEKSIDYFFKKIDKIYNKKWSSDPYYTNLSNHNNSENKSKYNFSEKKYLDLSEFLRNQYYYYGEFLKLKFDTKIKKYAAKKCLLILDEKLLKTGNLNSQIEFSAVKYLMKFHFDNSNKLELEELSLIIIKYPILENIYGLKIKSLLRKLKK